jgi:hypothetical protein
MVRALETDYTKAPLTEQERAMVDYVVKLTKEATMVSPADHERLHRNGFDDKAILQITLIASWFNYINRVADALGVGREDPEGKGEVAHTNEVSSAAGDGRAPGGHRGWSGSASPTTREMGHPKA